MSPGCGKLEQQRLRLAAQSDAQRFELISHITGAGDALQHLRLFLRIARFAARFRRVWTRAFD